jgi:hypothetical protein
MPFRLVQKVACFVIEAFQRNNVRNEAAIQRIGNAYRLPFSGLSQFVNRLTPVY